MVERITVYNERIAQAFWPGQSIWKNTDRVGAYNLRVAKAVAPKRTGYMAATIKQSTLPHGKYRCRYSVRVTANYAQYVLRGTHGPIVANGGDLLWIRPSPHSWFAFRATAGFGGRTPVFSVRGQRANDFLTSSLNITMIAVNRGFV